MGEEYRHLSVAELERIWAAKRDELIALRKEIDRRKGDVPPPTEVNFEVYVTK